MPLQAETAPEVPNNLNHVAVPEVDNPELNMTSKSEDVPVIRRTNSDHGVGPLVEGGPGLPASNSFPSLSDTVLRQLGALMEEVKQKEATTPKEGNQSYEKEIESKFTSLMLAFKTDKLTLERRLELQMRLRDQAEANMSAELASLKAAVQLLSPLCTDSEKIELLEKVSEQVDALHKSTIRVSTSAEMHGAVQQEHRLSRAVDIVLRHVENLKHAYDKEKTEHEETRKILTDNKISPSAATAKLESRSVTRARLGSLPRKLSNTILEADSEEPPPTKDQASSTGGPSCQSRDNTESTSSTTVAPARPLPRNAHLPEERRVSHSGEHESEEEPSPQEPELDLATQPPSETLFSSHMTRRRVSVQSVLLSKLSDSWEWLGPADLLVHLRWGVAVLLLVAALAVLTHCCLLPYTYFGS